MELPVDVSFPIYMDPEGGSAEIVERVRTEEESVLLSTSGWERIDIPGSSLSLVIMGQLRGATAGCWDKPADSRFPP